MFLYKLIKKTLNHLFRYLVLYRVGSTKGRVYVGGFTLVNKNVHLGDNANFNGMKILGRGLVTIGDNFHSGSECMMITESHNYQGSKIPYDDTFTLKGIIIEDNVWLGNHVLILGGITIGEGAIIHAGSVISSNIPAKAIAGGNPAKVFKYRDFTHYDQLKLQKSFH